jgi:flagellin
MDGTLKIAFGEYHAPKPGASAGEPVVRKAATFEVIYQKGMDAGKAHYYSRTEDIKEFYNNNGKFILEGEREQLTIRQGDREIKISIGSGVEIGKLAAYISERIWLDLLMQYDHKLRGADDRDSVDYNPYMMKEEDKDKIFQFINNVPGPSMNESVVGTFLAHSVLPGADSAMKFYGSEDLMKAFSFNTIQQAQDTVFRINVSDAHSGNTISSGTKVTAGTRAYGLIPGAEVALDFDSDIGVRHAVFNEKLGTFAADVEDSFSQFVHLADNAARLQIGANQGESTTLVLGDMTAKALDINDLDVRSREAAVRAITRLDNAIRTVSGQRSLIGAQINRLEHTIANLSSASINLSASKSRILDADMAYEMAEYTKLNILSQVASSMMAQANQMNSNVLNLLR